MFFNVSCDIFNTITANRNPSDEFVAEQTMIIRNLIEYLNENLKKMGKLYKCVYPGISYEFTFEHNYETYLKKQAV